MIFPSSSINVPPQTFDAIAIKNIIVNQGTPTGSMSLIVRVVPYNSTSSVAAGFEYERTVMLGDISASAASSPELYPFLKSLDPVVQGMIISQSVY